MANERNDDLFPEARNPRGTCVINERCLVRTQDAFTAFEMLIGTPAYMSPEQATLSSVSLIANATPPGLYHQSRMETERARECFRRLDSCRGADASDRIDRSGLALVLAWIPYQDERLREGKRESAEKTPTPQQEE